MGRRDELAASGAVGNDREDEVARLRARCDELERANRAKDHLLAVLGHELRAPLNAILGWTSRLQGGSVDEARRLRALDTIERNARTQERLIEQILDAARVSTDRLELVLAPIDLSPVVERVVEGFAPDASERRIALSCSTPEGILVLADRERLEQVVTNLVGNALKYAEAGGHVAVTIRRESGVAHLVVRDDGKGIEPELLPRVFDLYVQDATAKDARSGLGLGLHIVKTIIERHGGAVAAESEGVRRGATFTVRLPLHAGAISGTREKLAPP
jgi:signal transduction histidine kinase